MDLTKAAQDVLTERQRQIKAEGWTAEHDDRHSSGDLALAAACYAAVGEPHPEDEPPEIWPWEPEHWKPSKDDRRNLVKAAALLLAEIERLDRQAYRPTGGTMQRFSMVRWIIEDFKCVVGSLDPYPAGIEAATRPVSRSLEARVAELEAFVLRNSDPFDMTESDTATFHEIAKRLNSQNY